LINSNLDHPNHHNKDSFMKPLAPLLLAAAAATLAAPASAQFAKPEDAVKYRKSALTVMATHFGRVAAMASGRAPFDAKVAMDDATSPGGVSKLPWAAFADGSDKGDTKARPEIGRTAASSAMPKKCRAK